MPFVKVDPIKESQELQEIFKDDPETKETFKKYEIAHIESVRLQQEEMRIRNDLTEMRKRNNITQKDLQQSSGLSQQAISRIEVGKDVSPSLKSLIKYVDAIGCQLRLELKEEANDYVLKTNLDTK
jgi:DNA-binding XRE family transcriptional regulator